MKRQLREVATSQREEARAASLVKQQEAKERRAEERHMQLLKQREFQRELLQLQGKHEEIFDNTMMLNLQTHSFNIILNTILHAYSKIVVANLKRSEMHTHTTGCFL